MAANVFFYFGRHRYRIPLFVTMLRHHFRTQPPLHSFSPNCTRSVESLTSRRLSCRYQMILHQIGRKPHVKKVISQISDDIAPIERKDMQNPVNHAHRANRLASLSRVRRFL